MSDDHTNTQRSGGIETPSGDTVLIWEDDGGAQQQWWLARAHLGPRQFFIARDALTAALVGVERNPQRQDYRVIAVVPVSVAGTEASIAMIKTAILEIVSGLAPMRRGQVMAWWLHRSALLGLRQLPLAILAFAIGGALALAVAMFAVSTGMTGWAMAAAGIVIGAGAGPIFKSVAARKLAPDLGGWGRLVLATACAAVGAAIGAGGWIALFWP